MGDKGPKRNRLPIKLSFYLGDSATQDARCGKGVCVVNYGCLHLPHVGKRFLFLGVKLDASFLKELIGGFVPFSPGCKDASFAKLGQGAALEGSNNGESLRSDRRLLWTEEGFEIERGLVILLRSRLKRVRLLECVAKPLKLRFYGLEAFLVRFEHNKKLSHVGGGIFFKLVDVISPLAEESLQVLHELKILFYGFMG